MTRERRASDRTIKRLRQLQARLDVLLHESQQLRSIHAADINVGQSSGTTIFPSPGTPRPPRG